MRGFSHPLLSGEGWRRRLALWGGAVAVALVAIVFAKASDAAFAVFRYCVETAPWSAWLLTPAAPQEIRDGLEILGPRRVQGGGVEGQRVRRFVVGDAEIRERQRSRPGIARQVA